MILGSGVRPVQTALTRAKALDSRTPQAGPKAFPPMLNEAGPAAGPWSLPRNKQDLHHALVVTTEGVQVEWDRHFSQLVPGSGQSAEEARGGRREERREKRRIHGLAGAS